MPSARPVGQLRLPSQGLLNSSAPLRLVESGDFVFKFANRFPEQGDRPLLALGKIAARFLGLRLVSSWSANWTKDGAS
jgi:hypothetical protein